MVDHDDEDKKLRAVALQNANAILQARERAERALVAERERLRITLASIGDAVITADANGRVVFLNGVAEHLTGWVQAEAAGRPLPDVFRVVNEYTREPVENPALRAIRDGLVVGLANHTVLIARDGTERPIDDSAAPIRDEFGDPLGAVLVFRDVTERRRSEEAQARLAAIVESSEDAIVSKTLDGIIRTWNRGAERIFGHTAAEAVGKHITLIIPPDRHDEERDIIDRLRRGERVDHFETERVTKDGRRLNISLTVSPLRDGAGRVVGASKVARDVTGRRVADEALRDVRLRLQAALDAGAISTWTWDVAADRLFGDENMARLFSVDATAADGLPLADYVRAIHPDDWPRVSSALSRTLEGGGDYGADYRLMQPDGSIRWVAARGRVERDGGGRPVRMPGVLVDITERKRLEDELRVRADQLAEADRRKDEFLALLAHELRNPLAPIRNGLQVLKLADGDVASRTRARDMMDRQLTHMVRLVDDLLDVSRITRGKMELRRTRVRLADVVGSAVETARPLIDAAGHALEVSLPPEAVVLDADLTRLAQVLSNLLTNSAKYTPSGGRVWLTASRDSGGVAITVRDTGLGIPADALPRIFDMFSQVDRSVERSTGGLGIGLALVKGLVEMHGGTVVAESDGEGRGSTFTVRLPVLENVHESAAPVAEPERGGSGRRVLVVDDNRDGAESLAEMLRLLGHNVHTAHDGIEAVEAAARLRPDLVLMDVGMPRLNGLEATRRIREHPWGRSVVVIALTGWGQDGDRAQSKAAGCDGHLVKPVNLSDLQKLLGELA